MASLRTTYMRYQKVFISSNLFKNEIQIRFVFFSDPSGKLNINLNIKKKGRKAFWEPTRQPHPWYRSSSSTSSSFCITFGSNPTVQMLPRSLKQLIQRLLIHLHIWQPFSYRAKKLVKDWQNRSIWEEMGFIELPNLDASVGAQVQENVATAVQEIFSLTHPF